MLSKFQSDMISGLKLHTMPPYQAAWRWQKAIFWHVRSPKKFAFLVLFLRSVLEDAPHQNGDVNQERGRPGAGDTAQDEGKKPRVVTVGQVETLPSMQDWRDPCAGMWLEVSNMTSIIGTKSRKTKSWAPVGWEGNLEEHQKEARS